MMLKNWKLIIHLLLGTYKFGVNNDTWWHHRSLFGVPLRDRLKPSKILLRYRMMRIRAKCGFIPDKKLDKY